MCNVLVPHDHTQVMFRCHGLRSKFTFPGWKMFHFHYRCTLWDGSNYQMCTQLLRTL